MACMQWFLEHLPCKKNCLETCAQLFLWYSYVAEVAAVRRAMAGFSLPVTATPDWARAVSEDVWKAQLLEGLRRGQTSPNK